ncbi:MAG: BMP family ABC transporter substrate-binding protein [Clostridia bacterium]|nr:BMP family ABC transporter substrate-binding protein [Clostridia bacterium]
MRKSIALLLVLTLTLGMGAAALAQGDTYEIALVTDVGNIDDRSFNQASWEGVVEYATANDVTYSYYKPSEDTNLAREETMREAIGKGAKVLVLPGFLFFESAAVIAKEFADVQILLIDTTPAEEGLQNIYSVLYQEEQSGFFAGYAAVKDGYKKLGYLGGMAVPAVVRYGHGYVMGAEYAAQEMGLTDVEIKYWYSGSFLPNDEIKIKMSGWATEGTEVVFACGGGIVWSALLAAEEADTVVIGVDVDQSSLDPRIITSAMKHLQKSVVDALTALYANGGTWGELGGIVATLGAESGDVGIPTAPESWRLKNFTVDEYNAIFEKVMAGEIEISPDVENTPAVTAVTVDYQE